MLEQLAETLHQSRFYGSKTQPITRVEIVQQTPLANATHCIVRAHRADGSDLYQLVIDATGTDILTDPETATDYGASLTAASIPGTLHARRSPVFAPGLPGRSLGAEQSNTSLVFGTEVLVKVFRKLQPGINPNVELLDALAENQCYFVPELRGWVTQHIAGQEYVTALIQDFAAGAQSGWDTALSFANAGRSFADEARLLGTATGAVHRSLAVHFGTEQVPGNQIAAKLHARLKSLVAEIPQLAEYAPQAARAYDSLAEHTATTQRVHGDYHLGQVLRAADRYLLIDFEGEPARPLAERRQPDCPLRDLAGMIRSFDYAAQTATGTPASWATEARDALLAGYEFTPTAATTALLNAYLIDKLLYEVAYELNNRPDWAHIPINGLRALAQEF